MTSLLPAHAIVPDLLTAIQEGNVIVGAPPGAGKSTVLPLALLEQFATGKILLMQPRRVVVRNLANFLAQKLGESVGQTVGYRVKGESRVSAATRLEVITEGILARRIQQDPEMTDVKFIIFDEFHERSIHSDFGLALAIEVQQGLREDLRLVLMSATLDLEELVTLLPEAQVVESQGRAYPVEIHYMPVGKGDHLPAKVAQQALRAVEDQAGDILVFLPGVRAIRQVQSILQERNIQHHIAVHTLYGAMQKEAQQSAIQPDPTGKQKIILATNIAETSLTIEGVHVVIDSGLENVARYHPSSGITQISTQMISQASAEQRKGRAGRLGPGMCYRMWSQEQQERLAKFSEPQILREDVTSLLLETLSWGSQLESLHLLNSPTEAQRNAALHSLRRIQATDEHGLITPYGRQLAAVPCHPRLAHMMKKSIEWAALLERPRLPDAGCFIAAFAEAGSGRQETLQVSSSLRSLSEQDKKRLTDQAQRFARLSGISLHPLQNMQAEDLALCIALTYPDRIARQRSSGGWKMANGRGALMPSGANGIQSEWMAVLDGQQTGTDVTVRLAEPIAFAILQQVFSHQFAQKDVIRFNAHSGRMEARRISYFDQIELSAEPLHEVTPSMRLVAWTEYLEKLTRQEWPLDEKAWQWWYRLELAAKLSLPQAQAYEENPSWPVLQLDKLIDGEIAQRLGHCRDWQSVCAIPWASLLNQQLSWPQQQALAELLPTEILVPGGNRRPVQYRADGSALLSVKMQEMYGQTEPLRIAANRLTLVIELLSPAGRPLQTTSDPGAFWCGSYREIQKEMKGRYPKHYWPDDPATATATTRTKKAMG